VNYTAAFAAHDAITPILPALAPCSIDTLCMASGAPRAAVVDALLIDDFWFISYDETGRAKGVDYAWYGPHYGKFIEEVNRKRTSPWTPYWLDRLGRVTDRQIAREMGIDERAVTDKRNRAGIRRFGATGRPRTDLLRGVA
jgi:hypothetical protein